MVPLVQRIAKLERFDGGIVDITPLHVVASGCSPRVLQQDVIKVASCQRGNLQQACTLLVVLTLCRTLIQAYTGTYSQVFQRITQIKALLLHHKVED